MPLGSIHTLGDSTLDNLYWMMDIQGADVNVETAKKNTVEGVLQELVKSDRLEVVSHAYDGFTTRSVLEGDRVGAVLPHRDFTKDIYVKEKAPKGTYVKPLEDLYKTVQKRGPHYVVLSVGGNDFRENLANPWRFLNDISKIQDRYFQILEKIKRLPSNEIKPILVLQYRTDANKDAYNIYTLLGIIGAVGITVHAVAILLLTAPFWIFAAEVSILEAGIAFATGAIGLYLSQKIVPFSVTKDFFLARKIGISMLDSLMQKFYQPILEKAKNARIPVLDLSNTFNPFHKLYECGIEPGKDGSKLIAEGIHHIVKNHDFSGESILYSKPCESYRGKPNRDPKSWDVEYPVHDAKIDPAFFLPVL